MAYPNTTPRAARLEEAVTVLFCLVDDAYRILNPRGDRYASLKRLSDSEVLTLALLQQLRGTESERSFLRDAERFFSDLFLGVVGLYPSSFHRRVRKLRRFLEPLAARGAGGARGGPGDAGRGLDAACGAAPQAGRAVAGFRRCLMGEAGNLLGVRREAAPFVRHQPRPALLRAHRRQRRGCALGGRAPGGGGPDGRGRRRQEAFRGPRLPERGAGKRALAERGVLLATERADRRPAICQQVEVCFATLKGAFGMGETLATTLVGLATRIAAKVCAYTYGLYVNRLLGRAQGRLKELWA